jgi:hypothetical protein
MNCSEQFRTVAVLICLIRGVTNRLCTSNKLILDVLFACEPEGMLRIERRSKGRSSTNLKLSGRMQADGLSELLAEIEECNPVSLDLEEVTLLDRDSVRFLIGCESKGVLLINCPLYVQEWISRERDK